MESRADWIDEMATSLAAAERDVQPIEPLKEQRPEMTVEDAYDVQMLAVRRRIEAGAKVAGHKIGFTSKAMQVQLGVDVPDYGHLLDDMFLFEEEEVSRSSLIVPRVEPEIAFVLATDLTGPGVGAADVLRATDFVVPALEIIDSRVVDWRIKIEDTIADNASAARVVLGGPAHDVRDIDLPHVPVVLRRNGAIVETAAGAAVLGNPVSAVAWLANALAAYGVSLEAGNVVLSGSFCTSVFVEAGETISASFGSFGSVSTTFSA